MLYQMNSREKKYYAVTVPQGHQGGGRSKDLILYFKAYDAYHAMKLAMKMPSVKHHKMCLKVVEITKEEYYKQREVSSYEK